MAERIEGAAPAAPTVPPGLLAACREGRLAVFVGSGLSLGSDVRGNFPQWKDVGNRLLEDCRTLHDLDPDRLTLMLQVMQSARTLDELLAALDLVKTTLGNGYRVALQDIFNPTDARPDRAHELVLALAPEVVLTTNYDRLLELADVSRRRQMHTWEKATNALADLKGGRSVLFKVHGSVEDHGSVILTQRDYDCLNANESYRQVLMDVFRDYTVLFVGYGMNDPFDLDRALKINHLVFRAANPQHYVLLKGASETERDRYQRDFNVRVIGYEDHAQIVPFLEALPKPEGLPGRPLGSPPRRDAVARWRRYLRRVHEMLVPFFPGAGDHVLDAVYVELELERMTGDGRGCAPEMADPVGERKDLAPTVFRSLRALLEEPGRDAGAGRWAVLGEPGAGKTTLARHLAWQLAAPGEDGEAGPVPLYFSLARLARERRHPFNLAEEDLRAEAGDVAAQGLARDLWDLAERPGRVWCLLDGLDEIQPEAVQGVLGNLSAWARHLPNVALVVLSRQAGFRELGALFRKARVRPLDDKAQRALLERWLGEASGKRAWDDLVTQPALRDHARNPLLLTLVAALCRENAGLPASRVALYAEAVRLLLRRGQGWEQAGVKEPETARRLLCDLSLRLQEDGGESWPRTDLDKRLWEVRRADGDRDFELARTWHSNEAFLDDVGRNSGILAAHDGPREPWRYLHRSLREFLAAERLIDSPGNAVLERAKGLDKDGIARWGETLAIAAARGGVPLAVLERLREVNAELALRALLDVEGIPLADALEFLWHTDQWKWDGEYLLRLVRAWRLTPRQAAQVLRGVVTPERWIEELAYIHYALDWLGATPEREGFFRDCDRWPRGGPPQVQFVQIPAGRFLMGSPEAEEGRWADEGPEHPVEVPEFELAATPVTIRQYGAFDKPDKSQDDPDCPLTDVSWWVARLFCHWLGGRLPTEAEWEYACRAGTRTRYSSGESETDLGRAGWFDGNSKGSVHPVGEKPANAFGLHDMHGNVEEWCEDDWHENYKGAPLNGSGRVVDLRDSYRVSRGGSFANSAGRCRSSYRGNDRPGNAWTVLGFRPARSIP